MAAMSDVEEDFEDQTEDEPDVDDGEPLDEDVDLGDPAGEAIDDLADDDVQIDDDLDEETRNGLKAVEEVLSQKEQNARSLAIRRALELRAEERRLHDDLDYLDD